MHWLTNHFPRLVLAGILLGALAAAAFAQQVVPVLTIDGVTYRDVKFGPANQGKALLYHNTGVALIPLEKIPPEYGPRIFGYAREMKRLHEPEPEPPRPDPAQPRAPAAPARPAKLTVEEIEQRAFDRDRGLKVLLQGRLVQKSKLTALTGYLVRTGVEVTTDGKTYRGSLLELAQRKKDRPLVNPQLELRPGFWEKTGQLVLLLDYASPDEGSELIRIYGTASAPVRDLPAFVVGTEPTFAQWQKLRGR